MKGILILATFLFCPAYCVAISFTAENESLGKGFGHAKSPEAILALNLKGESLYAKREYEQAYDVFVKALKIDGTNIRALNNISLTSIKLDKTKKALISSHLVIFSLNPSKKEKAAALFNMGLACEGVSRMWVSTEKKWFCNENSIEYYADSYITFPTKMKSELVRARFYDATEKLKRCQLDDGQYRTYFKRENKYIFLHKSRSLLLPGASNNKYVMKFNKTGAEKLWDGKYISTYWASSNKGYVLDEKSCNSLYANSDSSDTHQTGSIDVFGKKNTQRITYPYELSFKFTEHGYETCPGTINCFKGKWIEHIEVSVKQSVIYVHIPLKFILNGRDLLREINNLGRVLEDGSYTRRLCKDSENTWVYRLVRGSCSII